MDHQKPPQVLQKTKFTPTTDGVTLPELLIAVAILGIISAVTLPNYLNAINSTRQKDVANQISQIQTAIQGYREEFLANPNGWSELGRITPVATNNGGATGSSFSEIMSINGGHYTIKVEIKNQDLLTISALANNHESSNNWDIKSCLNTKTGLSDIKLGGVTAGAVAPNCS